MYDRFSIAVVTAVVAMLIIAFIIVLGVLPTHVGTAPPYAEPPVVTTEEAGHVEQQ